MAMCHGFIDGKEQLIVKLNTIKNNTRGTLYQNAEELLAYLQDEEKLKKKQSADKTGEGNWGKKTNQSTLFKMMEYITSLFSLKNMTLM